MVALAAEDIFTEGLYPIEQAARIARLSTRVLRRWIDGDASSAPAMQRRIPQNEAGVVGFVDLVQALAIRALRKDRRLSLQKVRQTIDEAQRLGILYPFARRHQTYLFEDDVVIRLDDDTLIQVTGKYKRQHLIKPVVELYLDDLSFNAKSGLAERYTPLREDDREIVIDPRIKYGAPTLMPSGYVVSTLIEAVYSEGSIEEAAAAFELRPEDVKLALRYDDMLADLSGMDTR